MITFDKYKSKVKGCFMGKNIGGTFGAPFEGKNCEDISDYIDFYVQELEGKAIPNDDLDLQLVWLNAIEKYRDRLNSRILGEYWLSYIMPSPCEYGAAKGNLMMGLEPPLSGVVNNIHRDSCGAFIRSEIWACLAPGHPAIAVKYAIMDAEVDHSTEGVYGEVFTAALESAAFVEEDRYKLIDIAMSYIPENCGVKKAVLSVIDSYKRGLPWKEAFYELMRVTPSGFSGRRGWTDSYGEKISGGDTPAYDAPGNIGIFVIGWLYGEGDFGKSLAIALNCGEDADCTVATMGAVFGILNGIENIPEKWINPIGSEIITCCINTLDFTISIPKTVDELAERIMFLTPSIIGMKSCDIFSERGYSIYPNKNLYYTGKVHAYKDYIYKEKEKSPFKVMYEFEMLNAILDYTEEPYFNSNCKKKFKLRLQSSRGTQFWVNVKLYHPECVQPVNGNTFGCYLYQFYHAMSEMEFEIDIIDAMANKIEMVLELKIEGRLEKAYIPITLVKNDSKVLLADCL